MMHTGYRLAAARIGAASSRYWGSGTPVGHDGRVAKTRSTPSDDQDVVARLRATGGGRPVVDPGFAGGLRAWLEDELGISGNVLEDAVLEDAVPLAVDADLLAPFTGGHQRAVSPAMSPARAADLVVHALFRQWMTVGFVGDPLGDARSALAGGGDGDAMVSFVDRLDAASYRALSSIADSAAARIVGAWGPPAPWWYPRTEERLVVPLCGGRFVLSTTVDLALGAPASGRASVCLVDVVPGPIRPRHRAARQLAMLTETLRSGAPPFCCATWSAGTGELVAEPVGEVSLVAALDWVVAMVRRQRQGTGPIAVTGRSRQTSEREPQAVAA